MAGSNETPVRWTFKVVVLFLIVSFFVELGSAIALTVFGADDSSRVDEALNQLWRLMSATIGAFLGLLGGKSLP